MTNRRGPRWLLLVSVICWLPPFVATSAVRIETTAGDPLIASREAALLAVAEAKRLQLEAEARVRDLANELHRIERQLATFRRDLASVRQRLPQLMARQRLLVMQNAEDKREAEALRRSLAPPLSRLAQSARQTADSLPPFELDVAVRAMAARLGELEQRLAHGRQAAIEHHDRPARATQSLAWLSRRIPWLDRRRTADLTEQAQVEQSRAHWGGIADRHGIEVERLSRVLQALEAERGLILQLPDRPIGIAAVMPRVRSPGWQTALAPAPEPSGNGDDANLPVIGAVVARFGDEQAVPFDRGVTIEAVPGGRVNAPAAGDVVFAGPFQRYGQLLIIDHGNGYHSLLSGFGWLAVEVTDKVEKGQLVGSLGEAVEGNPRLYLELRRHGAPINPLPWLAARSDRIRG